MFTCVLWRKVASTVLSVPEPFWRAAHRVGGQLHGDKEYPFSGVTKLYILHVVQPADITLQGFLSAAQFLTVNSGGRFFNRNPSVLLSSTSERPSTAKTTQHPDPSIDPQVDPSHPSPHPSFPLCSSDLMSRSKY